MACKERGGWYVFPWDSKPSLAFSRIFSPGIEGNQCTNTRQDVRGRARIAPELGRARTRRESKTGVSGRLGVEPVPSSAVKPAQGINGRSLLFPRKVAGSGAALERSAHPVDDVLRSGQTNADEFCISRLNADIHVDVRIGVTVEPQPAGRTP